MIRKLLSMLLPAILLPTIVLSDSEPDGKAPYTLTIINHGESQPRSENTTSAGKQDNRRVDVTLARDVKTSVLENASIDVTSGGTIWITKDPASLDRHLRVDAGATAVVVDGKLESPLEFNLVTNYAYFIKRWEIEIYPAGELPGKQSFKTISGSTIGPTNTVTWDGQSDRDVILKPGVRFDYIARVYDESGSFDQTHPSTLELVSDSVDAKTDVSSAKIELEYPDGRNYEELAQESISIAGGKVRIQGLDLTPDQFVSIDGYKVPVSEGSFVSDYLLPGGKHDFDVVVTGKDTQPTERKLEVDLNTDYFFMVALADLTVGENNVSGSVETLEVDEHHYGGDIFVDGRLAFYLKGKIKGKYLLTAQMDTGTDDVENLFDDLHQKDARSVFRRLDPDQYYPVYGDDSVVYDDTDSQGKIYIRLEWDKSRLLWGNYNTSFTGTELAPFNRSLYGAQLIHRSVDNTAHGESRTDISVFASEAQSAHRHNEFLGTGGSLYYLRDTDIVAGSEKVWVEVRQSSTEQVLEKILLVAGRDYDIDDFQGRLILLRPLLGISAQSGPSIIKDEPLNGDTTWLVVDYEYVSSDFSADDYTAGARGRQWLSDSVAIGGTWANEQRDGKDYDIKGADLTLRKSDNTFARAEFARTESSQSSGSFTSTDGGLTFEPFASNTSSRSGDALLVEARADLRELTSIERDIALSAWARSRDGGYSTTSSDTGVDTVDGGVEAIAEISDKLLVSGRATTVARKNTSSETTAAVQADYALTESMQLSGELRHISQTNDAAGTSGDGTLAAIKFGVDISEATNVYTIGQATLSRSGNYESNNLLTVGGSTAINDKFRLNAEISTGDRGNSALAGMDWAISETYSIYSNVSNSQRDHQGRTDAFTVGQRKSLSSRLKVYSEHQFTRQSGSEGFAHTVGADRNFNEYLSGGLSYQRANLEDTTGASTDRDSLSASLNYQRGKTRANSKLEYRLDRGANLDLSQWVVTNRFEHRPSAALRWQGKLNASVSKDRLDNEQDARFIEAGVGFALRPVVHDRLNLLGRLTYLYDLPPIDQSDNTDQRSLIASTEGVYEITPYWSLGAKLAHRESELRIERDQGNWIGNDATLIGLSVQRRMPFRLEAMLAYHWLVSEQTDSLRQGALVHLGRRVSDHLKLSVGYNFTDFDTDLKSNDYDVNGWFINFVGTY